MAVRGVNPDQTFEYLCDCDKDGEQTVFVCGVLDARMRGFINDTVTKLDLTGKKRHELPDPVFRVGTRRLLLVKYGLRGWRNLFDASGQPIAEAFDAHALFGKSYRAVSDSVLDVLPENVLEELANAIDAHSSLQEVEKTPLG